MTSVNRTPIMITGHGENGFISLLKQKNGININDNTPNTQIQNTIDKYNSSNNFNEFATFNASTITFSPYAIKNILFNEDVSKKWNSSMHYVNEEEREFEQERQRQIQVYLDEQQRQRNIGEEQRERARIRAEAYEIERATLSDNVKNAINDNNNINSSMGRGGGIFSKQKYKDKYLKYKKKYLDLKNKY